MTRKLKRRREADEDSLSLSDDVLGSRTPLIQPEKLIDTNQQYFMNAFAAPNETSIQTP
jgi:hypothetical protein